MTATLPLGIQDADGRLVPGQDYDPVTHQFTMAQTAPAITDPVTGVPYAPTVLGGNTGLPLNTPAIVQKAGGKSTGSVASLAPAFTNANVAGNSIIVVAGIGNGTDPTIADSAGNTYTKAVTGANSTTFEASIFFAVNILAGTNTVTVTNAGAAASMAVEIYEVSGLLVQVGGQPGQTISNTGTGTTASTSALTPGTPNHIAFAGIAVGTAAQTITPAAGWTNDSGQLNPTTPAGLFSFASLSEYLPNIGNVTPSATLAGSEPWAVAVATFRPVILGVQGTFNAASPYPGGAIPLNATSGDVAAATAAATLAASAGKTTYITGFTFTSTGSTSVTTVDITVTDGTWTITFVYVSVAGATTANPQLDIKFPYPLAASGANTTIVASSPTLGSGNLHACMNAYGFRL